jgi:hypothetical protein
MKGDAMYAIFDKQAIRFLGSDIDRANEILKSKVGSTMANVGSLTELATLFDAHLTGHESDAQSDAQGFSQAAERVFQMLDDAGINQEKMEDVLAALKERGDKVVADVSSLGIKSMATVGDGFLALGDLLKKASEERDDEDDLSDEDD